jgi:hypothetical protein
MGQKKKGNWAGRVWEKVGERGGAAAGPISSFSLVYACEMLCLFLSRVVATGPSRATSSSLFPIVSLYWSLIAIGG